MSFIGFGKFNRFYWLILLSALFKVLINIFFKIDIQRYMYTDNISILESPVLNRHIFVRFIYYYFGFVVLGFITFFSIRAKEKKNEKKTEEEENYDHLQSINTTTTNIELIYNDINEQQNLGILLPLIIFVIIYIISEILTFYIDQKNMAFVNFWVLQIFFLHFLFFRIEKIK